MKKVGTLILALGLIIGFAGCKHEPDNPVLSSIEIREQPTKTTYQVGEALDTTGMKVYAIYDTGSEALVYDWTTSGFDSSKAAENQEVTVSYTEDDVTKTATFKVTIKAPVPLSEISVTAQPTKKEYFVGDTFDKTGLKVTAKYSDTTTKDVTAEVTTSGFDSSAATDSQTITVIYGGKTATFTVKILAVEVTKIEITTEPTRKVYYIGSSALDLTGMVVTATYNNGTTKDVTKDVTTSGFSSSIVVESQTITVTYGEKTATFTVEIKQGYTFHDTVTILPSGTTGSYGTGEATYVEFGDWPQDVVKEADEATLGLETSKDKVTRGYMEFVQGTDGNYYVKHKSKWYKVMPIKWRVFDEAYDVDGNTGSATGKLLVAENILTANVPYYEDIENNRTIDGKKVYSNNYMYSQIRAYLNGITYTGYDKTTSSNIEKSQWNSKGFLQTAFGDAAQQVIITTKVDNSADSTTNYDTTNGTITKATEYACDPTEDKIFLLSEYEVTKYSKSTETYKSSGKGNSRIRVTTDFAKANKADQSQKEGEGGYWWLRSPDCDDSRYALYVFKDGYAYSGGSVSDAENGVVPALSISF